MGIGPQKLSVPAELVTPRVVSATAPGKPKAPPPKTSYGKGATSLKVVTFGSGAWTPGSESNRPKLTRPTPSDHDRHQEAPRPPNPPLSYDRGSFAAAAKPPIPPPPAQPVRSRPVSNNPWADLDVDDVPQPLPWERAVTSTHHEKQPPRHQPPPPPAAAWDRLDAACDGTDADVRQPTSANKDGAARGRLDKQRAGKQRFDKLRLDKLRTNNLRTDKPRAEKPRAEKPRVDKSRADKSRASKPQVAMPQGTSLPHLHEYRTLTN